MQSRNHIFIMEFGKEKTKRTTKNCSFFLFNELICYGDVNLVAKRRRHTNTPQSSVQFFAFFFYFIALNNNHIRHSNSTKRNETKCCAVCFHAINHAFLFICTFIFFWLEWWKKRRNAACNCAIIQYVIAIRTHCVLCLVLRCTALNAWCVYEFLWFYIFMRISTPIDRGTAMVRHWYFNGEKKFWTRWQIDGYPLTIVPIRDSMTERARESRISWQTHSI